MQNRNRLRVAAALLAAALLAPAAGGAGAMARGGPSGGRGPGRSWNLAQVGFLALPGFNADVWAHRGFAYVGSWGLADRFGWCPAAGVRIIDLEDPAHPRLVTAVAAIPGTSQEDVEVARIRTPAFDGDLLVTGVQGCAVAPPGRRVPGGIDLWDVTDPHQPRHLAFWPSGGGRGVHELHLFQRGKQAYVAAAVPFSESADGRGDFRLVDVTDPAQPVEVSHWGIRNDLGLEPEPGRAYFAHSAMADRTGTRAIVSYWDAGAVYLDISDPAHPAYIGRTVYPAGAAGDTHSVALARGGDLLLVADEDLNPADGNWGFLRIWDVKDPAQPVEVGRFATAHALHPPDGPGRYSIHNPFVRGHTAYLSWYSDGVRVVDFSDPSAPREVAAFVPPPAPDPLGLFPPVPMVWGVYATGDRVLISDINSGLYVLERPS